MYVVFKANHVKHPKKTFWFGRVGGATRTRRAAEDCELEICKYFDRRIHLTLNQDSIEAIIKHRNFLKNLLNNVKIGHHYWKNCQSTELISYEDSIVASTKG